MVKIWLVFFWKRYYDKILSYILQEKRYETIIQKNHVRLFRGIHRAGNRQQFCSIAVRNIPEKLPDPAVKDHAADLDQLYDPASDRPSVSRICR